MAESPGRRFLIATGTAHYPERREIDDFAEVVDDVARIELLFGSPINRDPDTSGFGYEVVAGFETDLNAGELKQRLRAFLTAPDRSETDTVVFYYTGHAQVDDDGEFLLTFPDTVDEDVVGTAVPGVELVRWLLAGTPVKYLLLVLDMCFSVESGAVHPTRLLGKLRRPTGHPHVAILIAARTGQVPPGAFTQALKRAVRHRATGGHAPQYLQLDGVVGVINNDPQLPASQHVDLLAAGQGVDEFLLNPRYDVWLRGMDLQTQLARRERELRDRDFLDHVLPRARGLDSREDGLWLFTGRHAALATLSAWLSVMDDDWRARVVTGSPGSGKSSVLARLTVLARPEHRRKVPRFEALPPDTVPLSGSIDVFIHARGLTGDQVLASLCASAGVEADRPSELLAALRGRARPLVAVIDSLDEATDPDRLAEEVITPLMDGSQHTQLRLLLGTRRHLRYRLVGPAEWIDLDAGTYADPDSVRAYVRRVLVELNDESPYRDAPASLVDATAAAVAQAAGESFLVALIIARSLTLRHEVVDPFDRAWQERLPRLAAEAMSFDLDERLGVDSARARDLLLPLAFVFGGGIPWADMWAPLASAISGRPYDNTDLDWLERNAGAYVVEVLDGPLSVYRLVHESLAEHLRAGRDEAAIHHAIMRFMVSRAPGDTGRRNWSRAGTYVMSHFAKHAFAAGALDEFRIIAELNHALQTPLRGLGYAFQNMGNLSDDVLLQERDKRLADMTAMLDNCISALATFRSLVDTVVSVPTGQSSLCEAVRKFADSIPQSAHGPVEIEIAGLPERVGGFSNHYLLTMLHPLVENAIEGCAPGGTVEITYADHGYTVEFTVFNPVTQPVDGDVLFAPRRTTKDGHQGLGVSIVSRLAEFQRGDLTADIMATGVRMRVVLPRG